jgi:hypothetical protein
MVCSGLHLVTGNGFYTNLTCSLLDQQYINVFLPSDWEQDIDFSNIWLDPVRIQFLVCLCCGHMYI